MSRRFHLHCILFSLFAVFAIAPRAHRRRSFVFFSLTSPVQSKGGQHRKSIFETALGFVPSVLFLQRLAHVLLPCFSERVLQWIPFGNTMHIASFRICGGPVKVQCTCASHLWWTCKGTVHLCFASAVDSFCFEYSALAPQKKLLLVHFTPCNFSFLSQEEVETQT